jgi:hypothetical protein
MVSTVESELLILIGLVLVIGSGIIERLWRIERAIREDFESAVARSILHTEIRVTAPPIEKVKKPCLCGHPWTMHWDSAPEGEGKNGGKCRFGTDPGETPNCECKQYRPKRGPWPTDPPRM